MKNHSDAKAWGRFMVLQSVLNIRFVLMLVFFIWGFAPTDKKNLLYPFHGINYGDFLFIYVFVCFLLYNVRCRLTCLLLPNRELKSFLFLFCFFVLWCIIAFLINCLGYKSLYTYEFLGLLRLVFYFVLTWFVALWTFENGCSVLLTPYILGFFLSGVVNLQRQYESSQLLRIAGLPQLSARNFTGGMCAVIIVFSIFLLWENKIARALFFCMGAIIISAFTFSKGAWMMCCIAGLGFFTVLLDKTVSLKGRNALISGLIISVFIFLCLIGGTSQKERVFELVSTKIKTARGNAVSGVLESTRISHILSSFNIAYEHPLFGVTESHWAAENNINKKWLGNFYAENDNPHNGFMMILSAYGVISFCVFVCLIFFPNYHLMNASPMTRKRSYFPIFFMGLVFFIIGNLLLQIYTQYFFWIYCGCAYGMMARVSGSQQEVGEN